VPEGLTFCKKQTSNFRNRKSRNPCSCPAPIAGFRKLLPPKRLHLVWKGRKGKVGPGNTPMLVGCPMPKGGHRKPISPADWFPLEENHKVRDYPLRKFFIGYPEFIGWPADASPRSDSWRTHLPREVELHPPEHSPPLVPEFSLHKGHG
jgi:hypothetical protein